MLALFVLSGMRAWRYLTAWHRITQRRRHTRRSTLGTAGCASLQNLLIITAIKTETQRVMDYIKKLDNFDGPQIAGIAIDAGLHEEGFVIYKKFDQKVRTSVVRLRDG